MSAELASDEEGQVVRHPNALGEVVEALGESLLVRSVDSIRCLQGRGR